MANTTIAEESYRSEPNNELPEKNSQAISEKNKKKESKRQERPLWMLVPGVVLMIIIILIPLGIGFVISTLDLDLYTIRDWTKAPFIGIKNYIEAVNSAGLINSIWLSVSYSIIVTVICLPLGVAAALATQNAFKGRATVRSIFLIPYILPMFVVGTVWHTMFQSDGFVNRVLENFNIDPVLWLNGPQSYWAFVFVQIWASWPFIYLLTLAGLQSVDVEVHEASALDGVTWWAKLRYIIFPYIRGPVALALIISFLHSVNNFTLPFVLFGVPAPADVNVLPILTYITAFQNLRFGLSAAMAVASLILISIPLFIYLRAVKLDTGDEGKKK